MAASKGSLESLPTCTCISESDSFYFKAHLPAQPNNTNVWIKPTFVPELKHKILYLLPNIKGVSSLIHASPAMHNAYLSIRQRLLTRLAVINLADAVVDLRPAPLAQMRFNGKHVGRMNASTLFPAIRSAVRALHSRGGSTTGLELNADECFTVLCLEEIVRWDLIPNHDELLRDNLFDKMEPRRAQPMPGSQYWRNDEDRFYVIYLGEDGFYPPDVEQMKKGLLVEHWYRHDAPRSYHRS